MRAWNEEGIREVSGTAAVAAVAAAAASLTSSAHEQQAW